MLHHRTASALPQKAGETAVLTPLSTAHSWVLLCLHMLGAEAEQGFLYGQGQVICGLNSKTDWEKWSDIPKGCALPPQVGQPTGAKVLRSLTAGRESEPQLFIVLSSSALSDSTCSPTFQHLPHLRRVCQSRSDQLSRHPMFPDTGGHQLNELS